MIPSSASSPSSRPLLGHAQPRRRRRRDRHRDRHRRCRRRLSRHCRRSRCCRPLPECGACAWRAGAQSAAVDRDPQRVGLSAHRHQGHQLHHHLHHAWRGSWPAEDRDGQQQRRTVSLPRVAGEVTKAFEPRPPHPPCQLRAHLSLHLEVGDDRQSPLVVARAETGRASPASARPGRVQQLVGSAAAWLGWAWAPLRPPSGPPPKLVSRAQKLV